MSKGNKAGCAAIVAALLLAFTFLAGPAHAQDPTTIAVVPFTMHADKDLGFLQDGIVDMLTTRLSREDSLRVLDKADVKEAVSAFSPPWNEKKARDLGARLGADHVLYGSLTIFGDSVSMDAAMVDTDGEREPVTVYNQTKGLDTVIPAVDGFARKIRDRLHGTPVAEERTPATGAGEREDAGIYTHPEKLVEGGFPAEEPKTGDSPFITSGRTPGVRDYWRSREFNDRIMGVALGEMNQDGLVECALLAGDKVAVYQKHGQLFTAVGQYKLPSGLKPLWIDAGDVNRNGKAELFVTAVTISTYSLQSLVLEWDGESFVPIVEKSGWYYRALDHPSRGTILLGQRQGVSETHMAGIFELEWTGEDYDKVARVPFRSSAWVFGMNLGDPTQEGIKGPVAFGDRDRIGVYSASGKQVYETSDRYGGSEKYLSETTTADDKSYIPQRIIMADTNGDNAYELVVANNSGVTGRVFEGYRRYDKGHFEGLAWDGAGLVSVWETRDISGYISDYQVGDFDNDGMPELVATLVKKGFSITGGDGSHVVSYDMDALAAPGR
ncbi:MAG: FG-GAP-like repeat-containing protein [Desulfatibacillaceae bacterium]